MPNSPEVPRTSVPDAPYLPTPIEVIADQVVRYEATDGAEGYVMSGAPCVILTTIGRRTGAVRKTPLVRVELDGAYAAVASQGGAPVHPSWYWNLLAEPTCTLQDRAQVTRRRARLIVDGGQRSQWWNRAVEVYPTFADYARSTERAIPIFLLEAIDPSASQ